MKKLVIKNPEAVRIIDIGESRAVIVADNKTYKVFNGLAVAVKVPCNGTRDAYWLSFKNNRLAGKELPESITAKIEQEWIERKAITDRFDSRIAAGQNIIIG
jgi:hypothetical protein